MFADKFPLLHVPKPGYVKAVQLIQFGVIVSTPVLLCGHVTRLYLEKCLPYAPGYGLLEDCLEYTFGNQTVVLSGLYATVYWTVVCLTVAYLHTTANGFQLALIQLYFVESCCIRYYLKNLLKLGLDNSRCANHREGICKLYTQLRILICYFNQIHQGAFMTAYVCFVGVAIIIPSYALISSWSLLGKVQFVILLCIIVEVSLGLVYCFGNFGGIYCDSKKLIGTLRNSTNIESRDPTRRENEKLRKKQVNSMRPFEIMIGSVNFIDQLTPFIFLDFCFKRVVDLLLL